AYPHIPTLEYTLEERGSDLEVRLRWDTDVPSFNMPVLVGRADHWIRVQPATGDWITLLLPDMKPGDFDVAKDLFLIKTHRNRM
ncbi:MAG: M1 family peptidase, partial [Lewinella sp.]|nr:M1 family peptidase [Lewinella sp.]